MDYSRDDSPLRQAQLERIKSYQPPRWEDHFANTLGNLLPDFENTGSDSRPSSSFRPQVIGQN
jgi:hypothetical protein